MGYTFKRPDPAAMERVLTRFPYSPEGAILRLAWLEGLSREEIAALTWDQVQFEDNALTLPDRTVPLAPSAEDCLRERHRLYAQRDPHVIISDRYQRPMPPESVSRLARTALDTEGQKVSLKDLRQDFVIRQLQTHDWTYAARVSGMAVSTLRGSFSQYFQERPSAALKLLNQLRQDGAVVRIGGCYYPAGAVVLPEDQSAAVTAYLAAHGTAVRKELAELLNLPPAQCTALLRRMADRGELLLTGKRYALPPKEKPLETN